MSKAVFIPSSQECETKSEVRFHSLREARLERINMEVKALCHVWSLPGKERLKAANQVAAHADELVRTCHAVARVLKDTANLSLLDVMRMLSRDHLRDEAVAMREVGVGDLPAILAGTESDVLAHAFMRLTSRFPMGIHADEETDLGHVPPVSRMVEARGGDEGRSRDMGEAWALHAEGITEAPMKPVDGLLLNREVRGPWVDSLNAHLGPRCGLAPGHTLLIEGGHGSGKTSLAAAFAVDAMASGCPVLFWPTELRHMEVVEHLMAQSPHEMGAWWAVPFAARARRPLPHEWRGLLKTGPEWNSDLISVERGVRMLAMDSAELRRLGRTRHACNGLLVLDHIQQVQLRPHGMDESETLRTQRAVQRLVHAARETGVCLLILSRRNEEPSHHVPDTDTMADCVVRLGRATQAEDGTPRFCRNGEPAAFRDGWGDLHLAMWDKTHGPTRLPPDFRPPPSTGTFWCLHRALHDGDRHPVAE